MKIITSVTIIPLLIICGISVVMFAFDLTLNEVMFNAVGADDYDEFVEIVNTGYVSADLRGLYLLINNYADTLVFIGENTFLETGGYALIMDRGYLVEHNSVTYDNIIPDSVLACTIHDNAFGRSGLNNSDPVTVFLLNNDGDTLSAMITSPNQDAGFSDEKIDVSAGDAETNWGNSVVLYGTPGFRNSIARRDYDLAISSFYRIDETKLPRQGEPVEFILTIKNLGIYPVENSDVIFGVDKNLDSTLQQNEVTYNDILTISPNDSVVLFPQLLSAKSGETSVLASILLEDEQLENNHSFICLKVPYSEKSVIINEFMYAPIANHGGEWVELKNISADTIDLADWEICDAVSATGVTTTEYKFNPDGLVILSSDSSLMDFWETCSRLIVCDVSLPSFNNDKDVIVIRDLCGMAIDSLQYSSSWGYQAGVSLERINPYGSSSDSRNWELSADASGATPGLQNSQAAKNRNLAIEQLSVETEQILHETLFSVSAQVVNRGIEEITGYGIRIRIAHQDTIIYHTLVHDTVITFSGTLISGETSYHSIEFSGITGGVYTLFSAVLLDGDEKWQDDTDSCALIIGFPENSIIVNEVMNIPETGEEEWFEIYNRSEIPVDLNQWWFRDAAGKWKLLTTTTDILQPEDFCIIAASGDFQRAYPDFSGRLIIPSQYPVLNNASDSLFLKDAAGHLVESVCFRQDWGGSTGISLERRDPNAPAQSSMNWGGSMAPVGATPGHENSILKYQYDITIAPNSFIFIDSTVNLIHPVEFQIEVRNSGSLKSRKFSLEIYHDRDGDHGATANELVWSMHSIPELLPDSTIHLDGEFYTEKPGRCPYIAMVAMAGDENIFDNVVTTDLLVAYPQGSLLINEFLAYPNSEQVEFCEIVNVSNDVIDINEWQLAGSRRTAKMHLLPDYNVMPGEYVVFTKDSSFFEKFFPVSDNVIVLDKCPGFSNAADKIILKDLTGQRIDSLQYGENWMIKAGISLEKMLPHYESSNVSNWSLSTDSSGATPGRKNSVMPHAFDLQLDSVHVIPVTGTTATDFKLTCWFSNVGLNEINSAEITCFTKEINGTGENQTTAIGPLAIGERDSIQVKLNDCLSGYHCLIVAAYWERDQNHGNDTLNFTLQVAFRKGALLLSEFMAWPAPVATAGSSVAEYIELYNPGEGLSLEAWSFCDENTANLVEINTVARIPNGGFYVIADDSSIFLFDFVNPENTAVITDFPSLGNSGDSIYLIGPAGTVVDSLVYDTDWTIEQNCSLERVYYTNSNNRNNWRLSTATEGGTPGFENSVMMASNIQKLGIRVSPNPFSPNGDGVDEQVAVQYQLPFPSANVTVQIYDMMGRLIFEPARNLFSASQGAVFWDGTSIHGNRARIGMYVVRCSATDAASDKTVGYITTVVLAR